MKKSDKPFEAVSIVGLGYIGLPTAATLATRGLEVIGVDTNETVVARINNGKSHFLEPDLDMLLEAAVATGKLRATTTPEPADAFIIAVPTPFLNDKSADLTYVESAARGIAKVLREGDLIILESTCPVGTTAKLCEWIHNERPDLIPPTKNSEGSFHVAYCPERILPGRMVFELLENDRIVGGVSGTCSDRARALYKLFVRGELLETRAPVAEFVKLIENAYRDVNIAFANELSMLSEHMQIDVWQAIALANRHPRVNILNPGPGVGGHCIAVDPWFLISASREKAKLMAAARYVNDAKPDWVVSKVLGQMTRFKQPIVACFGLTYKPDVEDLRQSPALAIVNKLAQMNASKLLLVEPHVDAVPECLAQYSNVMMSNIETAISQADILVFLVGHQQFRRIPEGITLGRVVIDTVGFWR